MLTNTVGENIIATIKMQNSFYYPVKFSLLLPIKLSLLISLLRFMYEFGSWLLFCIASHIVIALPTFATAIVVALLSL